MDWTEGHDVLLLREMLVRELFTFKKGSVSRGEAWDSILEKLQTIESPKFSIKDKRAVRDRWQLLSRKYLQKMREEELASGISVAEQSERDVLIEELVEREKSSRQDSTTALKQKDKESAEDIRKKALETMGQTKKRKSEENEDDGQPCPKKRKANRRCSEPLIDFLQEKSTADREFRQEELELKKKEHEDQQELMRNMMTQQQQLNQAFVSVLQKLLDK